MGYRVLGRTEDLFRGYTARPGLEGPFVYGGGRILYYDPREGAYWDPRTDFYLSREEAAEVQNSLFDLMKKNG